MMPATREIGVVDQPSLVRWKHPATMPGLRRHERLAGPGQPCGAGQDCPLRLQISHLYEPVALVGEMRQDPAPAMNRGPAGAGPLSFLGHPRPTSKASPAGTLRVALPGQPESLDPTKAIQNMDLRIMTALSDSLVARESTGDNELIPALVTSWKSNADATE